MQIQPHPNAGKVVALQGRAVARSPDGRLRVLQLGDWVAHDEVIITSQNGFVQLATGPDAAAAVPAAAAADAPLRLAALGAAGTAPTVVTGGAADAGAATSDAATRSADALGGAPLTAALRVDALADPVGVGSLGFGVIGGVGTSTGSFGRTDGGRGGDRLAPFAVAQQLTGREDTPLAIALSGEDPDGRIAEVWVVKVPTGGVLYTPAGSPIADRSVLTPSEAGALRFEPAPDFHGNPGPLQFFVVDASGKASAVQTVGIWLESVNDAPIPGTVPFGPDDVAIPDPSPNHLPGTPDYRYATAADQPLAGAVTATDVDGDPIRFQTATGPQHGQLALGADGRFVYTPEAGYTGSDAFVVQVDDGRGGVARSTVTVSVGEAPATPGAADEGMAAAGAAHPGATDAGSPAAAFAGAEAPATAALAVALSQALVDAVREDLAPVSPAGDVFAWHLAEPAAAPWAHASVGVADAVLSLDDLLPGAAATSGWGALGHPVSATGGPAVLDLGLDWGLRGSGLERWTTPALDA
ncbi:Ig-like domain-containing protein [Piscinibacter sakaiensis]|uniref:Tandem-95 repeat protein n=1 Tax=Piscinibacter sakaiensis TaxID=1547922 RepID=A0A0K8NZS9_PISS1|nr:Ig-like domain-containing protein [Piscinibacter sakaiensis]GAP35435.1 hypothetical protein ISF6_1208 [Piscinibacter sakaiensis]